MFLIITNNLKHKLPVIARTAALSSCHIAGVLGVELISNKLKRKNNNYSGNANFMKLFDI